MSIQSILIIKGGSPKLMNMLLDKDGATNQVIVEALLENECQFFITYVERKEIRIAFHKGTWKVMRKANQDYFELSDSPQILWCENSLLHGLIDAKIQQAESKSWPELDFRKKPAWIITEVLKIWAGGFEDIVNIQVTQFGRDGWFTNFDDK